MRRDSSRPGEAREAGLRRPAKALGQLKKEGAADRIFEALRDAIINHAFQPGERLDIQALARQFDVSSMPVRNAVQMLASTGLVEIKPRSGTYIARLSAEDLGETFDIRRALECLAAEEVIQNINDPAMKRLYALVDRMKDISSAEEHARNNNDFHRMLVRLSRNQKLLEVYDELNAHIRIGRIHGSEPNWRARLQHEYAEHREILQAIENRDLTALKQAVTRHIDRAKEALIQSLGR